jgi:hypothetical protein
MPLTFRKAPWRIAAIVTTYAVIAGLAPTLAIAPAQAAPLYPAAAPAQSNDDLIEVRGGVARGGAVRVGPRGGAVVRGGAVYRGPAGGAAVRRSAVVGPRGNVAVRTTAVRGAWARPGRYRWPRGGAIAAGAAIGFVAAASAVAWAGAPPADGLCWYYTDMTRTQGFWDYCP